MIGFALTSYVSYNSNREAFEKDAERTSLLAAQDVSRDINAQFSKPIDVSLAMAHDTLLASMLAMEPEREEDAYVEQLRSYLDSYRSAFGFDSAFLVSASTGRYYHFNGLDRIMEPENPENAWYYAYLGRDEEHSINIDNDEATEDEITVFVNARMLDDAGATRAVVGVGFRMGDLQALLADFEASTETRVRLIDRDGTARITTDPAEEGTDPFGGGGSKASEGIRASTDAVQSLWYDENGTEGYLVSQYLPSLDWFLVVDHDTSQLDAQTARGLATAAVSIALVIGLVVAATSSIFHRSNRLAANQAAASEQKRKSIFQEAAEQLYDNIYEIDVTHNRTASAAAERYFQSLGAPPSISYDEAIAIIAEKQIAADDRQGYLDTFRSTAVLAAHGAGKENLTYEFMMTDDGVTHHWMRIYAHLFLWDEDESVRMLVCRQNIDDEKAREQRLFEQMQRDPLTGLLNKAAAQRRIEKLLDDVPDKTFAFFILDIDDFKKVNDRFGHDAGDAALARFGEVLHGQFRAYDMVGRIGGDEFVAFVPVQDEQAARAKAAKLVEALRVTVQASAGPCAMSATVGVALGKGAHTDFESIYRCADQALYRAKAAGKNRFDIYGA